MFTHFLLRQMRTKRCDLVCLISPFLDSGVWNSNQKWPLLTNLALFTEHKMGLLLPKTKHGDLFLLPTVQFSSIQWYQIMLWFALHSELFLHLMHFLNMHNYTVLCMYIGYDEEYVLRCTLEERCPVIGEVQLGQKLYPPNRPLSPPAVWANRGFFFGENLQNLQNSVF